MEHKTMARGCPWRVMGRHRWHCKALVGQPNGALCDGTNCGGLYIADLLINELRVELLDVITELSERGGESWLKNKARRDLAKGGRHENATSTAASAGRDKS